MRIADAAQGLGGRQTEIAVIIVQRLEQRVDRDLLPQADGGVHRGQLRFRGINLVQFGHHLGRRLPHPILVALERDFQFWNRLSGGGGLFPLIVNPSQSRRCQLAHGRLRVRQGQDQPLDGTQFAQFSQRRDGHFPNVVVRVFEQLR